ncbi:MAG: TAXI family TRAP transporter solute-binding subunit [Thermodesulfobacteriota bacterium]|nr:TAXI family TRAP transporter solute-binding subunit [Thermodesulfobacteriota bacterium]
MKKYGGFFFVFIALLILTLPNISEAKKTYLFFGSSAAASSHYAYVVGAAKAINKYVPDVKVNVAETGASVDNLKRVKSGEIDMGICSMKTMYEAWQGLSRWKNNPLPDVRLLWLYAVGIDFIVVREDSGVKKLEDLNGKKFNPGIRGSASEATTKQIFKILGIKPDYHIGATSDAVKAIKDNRIVGYVKTGIGTQIDASTLDIMTLTKVRLIPMTNEHVKKILDAVPYISFITVPAGGIKAMPNRPAYTMWGRPIGVMGSKNLKNDIVYKLVNAIIKGKEFQLAAWPAFKELDLIQDPADLTLIPLHKGALKAYRELGAKNIPAIAIPPEAK